MQLSLTTGDVPDTCQFDLVADGAVPDELIEADRQGQRHQEDQQAGFCTTISPTDNPGVWSWRHASVLPPC